MDDINPRHQPKVACPSQYILNLHAERVLDNLVSFAQTFRFISSCTLSVTQEQTADRTYLAEKQYKFFNNKL